MCDGKAKSVFDDLDTDVDQLWAEAVTYWRAGELLWLPKHIGQIALEGVIIDFVERQVPHDWYKWLLDHRRIFWSEIIKREGIQLADRDRICALEVR